MAFAPGSLNWCVLYDPLPNVKTVLSERLGGGQSITGGGGEKTTGENGQSVGQIGLGSSLLRLIAQRSDEDEAHALAQMLVEEFGVDPLEKDSMGQSCLFYAAREGKTRLCSYLISLGCNVNCSDAVGQTSLFYAAREGRTACLKCLIDAGGGVNLLDNNKQSCLFYAARDGRLETVELLLERGANASLKDNQRRTALTFAKGNGHTQVVDILRRATAGKGVTVAMNVSRGTSNLSNSSVSGPKFSVNTADTSVMTPLEGSAMPVGTAASKGVSTRHGTHVKSTGDTAISDGKNNKQVTMDPLSATHDSPASTWQGAITFNNSSDGDDFPVVKTVLSQGANTDTSDLKVEQQQSIIASDDTHLPSVANLSVVPVEENINNKRDISTFPSDLPTTKRHKYRLQFRPVCDDVKSFWTDAPLVKVEEFERKFPHIAVWAKDRLVPEHRINSDPFVKEWRSIANTLMTNLSKYQGAQIFEKPVDCKKQNCPDYYDVIKQPMSFSCIKGKLRRQEYTAPSQVLDDVQLVFDNCALYNKVGSVVALTGKAIEQYFNNQVIVSNFATFVRYESLLKESLELAAKRNRAHNEANSSSSTATTAASVQSDKIADTSCDGDTDVLTTATDGCADGSGKSEPTADVGTVPPIIDITQNNVGSEDFCNIVCGSNSVIETCESHQTEVELTTSITNGLSTPPSENLVNGDAESSRFNSNDQLYTQAPLDSVRILDISKGKIDGGVPRSEVASHSEDSQVRIVTERNMINTRSKSYESKNASNFTCVGKISASGKS